MHQVLKNVFDSTEKDISLHIMNCNNRVLNFLIDYKLVIPITYKFQKTTAIRTKMYVLIYSCQLLDHSIFSFLTIQIEIRKNFRSIRSILQKKTTKSKTRILCNQKQILIFKTKQLKLKKCVFSFNYF